MSETDDLLKMYNERARDVPTDGEAVGVAVFEAAERTFALIERAAGEVERALSGARYAIRLSPTLVDRATYVRLDRSSDALRDHLRNWGRARGVRGGSTHWEARLTVADTRRETAEVGLGLVFERGERFDGRDDAFVEFWTTGRGMVLPSGRAEFARALVESILRLESLELIRPASPARR